MLTERKMPRVAILNRSDSTGGAAVVSLRLTEALRRQGCDARMLVTEKLTDREYVIPAASPLRCKLPFMTERLGIFISDGLRRDTLFRIDNGACGLPLWEHPVVKDADIICLNWINQGMLSLRGVEKILKLGKPVIWTMHDMWNITGVCHHAGQCKGYLSGCGDCPLLGFTRGKNDLSHRTFKRKKKLYDSTVELIQSDSIKTTSATPLTFVAVSHWMGNLVKESRLGREMPMEVIPNAFPTELFPDERSINEWRRGAKRAKDEEFVIAMGAARLDDPVKGMPLLIEATHQLRETDPQLASRTRLVTFGNLRNPASMDNLAVTHTHLGPLQGITAVRETLRGADVIVSSSLYETLPGTLIEGQACGAIPVSFDRGGQPDIISHGVTGYLAHMEDNDEASARNLAEGLIWAANADTEISAPLLSRSVRELFSADAVARRYIELFRKVSG